MHVQDLDRELEAVSQAWNLLQHPFYRRWVRGELTLAELVDYTCQYFHVVERLPIWLECAAANDPRHAAQLRAHADEEAGHIALWRRFAEALKIGETTLRGSSPNGATAAMLCRGDELAEAGLGAAVVWALETQSPAVSEEKLRGLEAHYGIGADTGGEYFALHRDLDIAHEGQLKQIIHAQKPERRKAALTAAAATVEGLWNLLSSVQQAA